MYLIPFFIEEPKELSLGCKMWTAWIFTSNGGKDIWTTDTSMQSALDEFVSNNLYGTCIPSSRKDIVLYKIDTTKTCVADFYTWTDMLKGTACCDEVWRPFFWVGNTMGEVDEWGWGEELKELRIGKFGSVESLWKVLREGAITI